MTLVAIVLGILLFVSIILYIKKTDDEYKKDIIQENAFNELQQNCNNSLKQKQMEIDLMMKSGFSTYGLIEERRILLRVLNPRIFVTLMMLTDKLNVDKNNNQTYTDKLSMIDSIFSNLTFNKVFPEIANSASSADKNYFTKQMDDLRKTYMDQINKEFDEMNNKNRKIAANLLNLDMNRYMIVTTINFSNINAYNNINKEIGCNISDLVDWNVTGRAGTDVSLNVNDLAIIDMTSSDRDFIDPETMTKKTTNNKIKNDYENLLKILNDPRNLNMSNDKKIMIERIKTTMEKLASDLKITL